MRRWRAAGSNDCRYPVGEFSFTVLKDSIEILSTELFFCDFGLCGGADYFFEAGGVNIIEQLFGVFLATGVFGVVNLYGCIGLIDCNSTYIPFGLTHQ